MSEPAVDAGAARELAMSLRNVWAQHAPTADMLDALADALDEARERAATAEADVDRLTNELGIYRFVARRAEAAEAELAIARATAYQVADVMTGEADVLRAEVARLRAALPEAGTLDAWADYLALATERATWTGLPAVGSAMRQAAARIRALDAGAET